MQIREICFSCLLIALSFIDTAGGVTVPPEPARTPTSIPSAAKSRTRKPTATPTPTPSPEPVVRAVLFRYPSGRDVCLPYERDAQSTPCIEDTENDKKGQEKPLSLEQQQEDERTYSSETANCLRGGTAQPALVCLERGLNDRIRLKVDHLREWIKSEKNPNGKNLNDLILFLNERPMKGLHPFEVDPERNILQFRLVRDSSIPEQRTMWDDLLSRATSFKKQHEGSRQNHKLERTVRVSVGFENEMPFKSSARFNLIVLDLWSAFWFCVFFGLLLAALVIMGIRTPLLRNDGGQAPAAAAQASTSVTVNKSKTKELKASYSLARVQMAHWTFLIVCGFVVVLEIVQSFTLTQRFHGFLRYLRG